MQRAGFDGTDRRVSTWALHVHYASKRGQSVITIQRCVAEPEFLRACVAAIALGCLPGRSVNDVLVRYRNDEQFKQACIAAHRLGGSPAIAGYLRFVGLL